MKHKTTSIRIDTERLRKLDEFSKQENYSRNQSILHLVDSLNRCPSCDRIRTADAFDTLFNKECCICLVKHSKQEEKNL